MSVRSRMQRSRFVVCMHCGACHSLHCVWDGDCIIVGGGVRISPPYSPADCALVGNQPRGQQALDQVRRVVGI